MTVRKGVKKKNYTTPEEARTTLVTSHNNKKISDKNCARMGENSHLKTNNMKWRKAETEKS